MAIARFCLVTAIVTTAFVAQVWTQEPPVPVSMRGTLDLQVLGAAGIAAEGLPSVFNWSVAIAGVRLSKVLTGPHGHGWFRGTFEYGVDILPVFVVFHPQQVYGGGFNPIVARWNLRQRARSAAHFEIVAGAVFTTSNVPQGDTSSFNFVPKIGAGWQFFTRPQQSLDIGLQFWHLSNAYMARENPSLNGLQIVVGYHWFKLRKTIRSQDRTVTWGEPCGYCGLK